ncbi:ribosomal protein S18 [Thelonectria olida]|uniref:Small ribosomal subunit protein bS18m n=1 Tax=Thelonectria olida TaxID=1576542 RepID=A0A9P8W948_9HYPO|nr:ribosomal protein S18 [Thelonectria olida]
MPPRLPIPSVGTAIARCLARPFSSSAPVALGPRSNTISHRLSKLDQDRGGPSRSGGGRGGDAAARMLERYKSKAEHRLREKTAQLESLKNQQVSNDYLRQMPRRWMPGDVYSPHDLSPIEMQKWRKRSLRDVDVVDALGFNPLDMYKNFTLVEHFTTPSGMINHSKLTRLRPVNQRKVAKMIRRVQGMGLYPSVHAHPEMLRDRFFPSHRGGSNA